MGEKETATEETERFKPKTKSNQSNDRIETGDATADADDADARGRTAGAARDADQGFRTSAGGDSAPEAAINNTKSNIKNRQGMLSGDDDAAQELAVSDEGVPADKPRPKSS